MYWGEYFVNPAVSHDLINWMPLLNEKNEILQVIALRRGYFDSDLTECGSPALLTGEGILLLYNGKNATGNNGIPAKSYCAGQVPFDKQYPIKLIATLDQPLFIRPIPSSDQINIGSALYLWRDWSFIETNGNCIYGCADSRVGVAIFDPEKNK